MVLSLTQPARTKREHVSRVSRVKWSDDDSPYVILELQDGRSAAGSAPSTAFASGNEYRFLGRWETNKYGDQFKFDTYAMHAAHGRAGVTKYLADTCTGIGRVIADRMFEKYGADAVRMLREEPDRIASDGFMSREAAVLAANQLAQCSQVEETRIDLFNLFTGRGFTSRLIRACIVKWGVTAPEKIMRNPFVLLSNRMPGCGFKRVDKLYLDLGGNAASFGRQAHAAANFIREDRSGGTWIDAKSVCQGVLNLIPTAEPIRALKILDRAKRIRIYRNDSERFVALAERANAEQRIADSIARLQRETACLWPSIEKLDSDETYPSEHQIEQLAKATTGKVGVFIGGPGTGKTFALSFLLRAIIEQFGEESVCIAAPTGKAAVRATESLRDRGIELKATTIHQLLEIGRNGHDGDGWGFLRNRINQLECQFVIIDESSMIDASLMADLLDALPDHCHLLLIGDPYQLPPVGHGAPLRDLIAAGVSCGELTEVRRNSGLIVLGCAEVKQGKPPIFAEKIDLNAEIPANLRFVQCDADEMHQTISSILAYLPSMGFDNVAATQVITGLNEKSGVSRDTLNGLLGKVLNPNGRSAGTNKFRVGDKAICLRNTRMKIVLAPSGRLPREEMRYDATWYHPGANDEQLYVANGELGRVVAVSEKSTVIQFGEGQPLVSIAVGKKAVNPDSGEESTGSISDIELAWAITVHKSQGSEWPVVIIPADPSATMIADSNWWYTAISRARKLCIIVGSKSVFESQIRRRSIDKRKTFLAELIRSNANEE